MVRKRTSAYRNTFILGGLVLVASGVALWSNRQVPDSVLQERQHTLLPALRRDLITTVEVQSPAERYELIKGATGWAVVSNGRRFNADETELDRLMMEADMARVSRKLGPLDRAARERFGLLEPRARVTFRENAQVAQTVAVGGLVADEPSVYVEVGGQGYVVNKSFADQVARRAIDVRDRSISSVDPTRLTRIAIEGEGGARTVERTGPVWRVAQPALGRASRARIEAMLDGLRDLRATRFERDDADDAAMARAGLSPAKLTVRVEREGGAPPVVIRFGGACEGYDDEIAAVHGDSRTIACVSHAAFDNFAGTPEQLRSDKLFWARTDEISRATLHSAAGQISLRRDGDTWRLEGAPVTADGEAVESWLNSLGGLNIEARLDPSTAAAHGLAPVARWVELTRTGVDGTERVNVGTADADRMYAAWEGETGVLGLEPAVTDALVVDAARFRERRVVRDVPDQLTAVVADGPGFHDEAMRTEGTWRLTRPFEAAADPSVLRDTAQRIATLDAERWVSLAPTPEYGLGTPRLRLVARFEGEGPELDPADGGAADASRPRVREYTLAVGAAAPRGGAYATISGRDGVFLLPQSVLDDLMRPHVSYDILAVERGDVQRIEIMRPRATGGTEHVALRRDGDLWRTDAGAPADRTHVSALLDRLALVRAPKAFGYGPPPPEAHLGATVLTLTLGPSGDGGAPRTVRVTLGAAFGSGDGAGVYARRDGLDATLSVPRELADALRDFTP